MHNIKNKLLACLDKIKTKTRARSASVTALALSLMSISCFAADGETGGGGTSLQTILTSIGSILTSALSWVGQVCTVVTSNPLILFFVILGGIYIGVNMLRKLLHI